MNSIGATGREDDTCVEEWDPNKSCKLSVELSECLRLLASAFEEFSEPRVRNRSQRRRSNEKSMRRRVYRASAASRRTNYS